MSNTIDVSCIDRSFLKDWYDSVPTPSTGLNTAWRDDEEFPDLHQRFIDADGMADLPLPAQAFGGIGEAIPILTNDQVLFLLPHMLLAFASPQYSEESVYNELVVDAILRVVDDNSLWPNLMERLDPKRLRCVQDILVGACEMCWKEEPEGEARRTTAIAKIIELTT